MKNNLIGFILAVTVSIVVIGSVMVPTLNQASTTHETFDNTEYSYYQMKELEIGDVWSYEDDVWSYNGDALTSSTSSSVSIISADTFILRQDQKEYGVAMNKSGVYNAEISDSDSVTVAVLNSTNSLAFTTGFGATNDGDYVMKTYTDFAYVNGDSPIWVTGQTGVSSYSSGMLLVTVSGSIEDGLTATATAVSDATVSDISVGEVTLEYDAVDGYTDLYMITDATFDVTYTYNETESTTTFTYSTFIIPKTVTSELTVHLNETEITLLGVIPVFVIIAVVLAAAYFLMKRD